MRFDQLTPELQLFARRFIRRKARRLVAKRGFCRSDRDDLEQELMLHLLERLRNYQPGRGTLFGFITAVVDRRGATLLVRRRAVKRGVGRCESLRTATLDEEHSDEPVGGGDQEGAALRLDISTILAQLPAELQKLCELLKTESPTTAARVLGISSSTLYRQRERLQAHFAAAGLRADL